MITRKIRQIIFIRPNSYAKLRYQLENGVKSNIESCSWCNMFSSAAKSKFYDRMSSAYKLRVLLRELSITRLWGVCSKSHIINSVLKRWRRERVVREMLVCFRQTFLRPRRTMILSATAAYKNTEGEGGPLQDCSVNIDDDFLKSLIGDFAKIEELSRLTLFCDGCEQRLIIDKSHPGVSYCACKGKNPRAVAHDGWEPYMEAQDVIIWKKEYKAGSGIYAYRVYGRYKEITAEDFASVQVDIKYRKKWDTNVAALSIVENQANGLGDQVVLHWEVYWPKFFSNRDYVYLRRHRSFLVKTECLKHKEGIFLGVPTCPSGLVQENMAYVIVSRSCKHSNIPEGTDKVRVREYWSHMVVQTLNGKDKPGMEYVLTYYDEPATGSMAGGLTSWATGRAVPSFLEKMRNATHFYAGWRKDNTDEFTPRFSTEGGPAPAAPSSATPSKKDDKPPQQDAKPSPSPAPKPTPAPSPESSHSPAPPKPPLESAAPPKKPQEAKKPQESIFKHYLPALFEPDDKAGGSQGKAGGSQAKTGESQAKAGESQAKTGESEPCQKEMDDLEKCKKDHQKKIAEQIKEKPGAESKTETKEDIKKEPKKDLQQEPKTPPKPPSPSVGSPKPELPKHKVTEYRPKSEESKDSGCTRPQPKQPDPKNICPNHNTPRCSCHARTDECPQPENVECPHHKKLAEPCPETPMPKNVHFPRKDEKGNEADPEKDDSWPKPKAEGPERDSDSTIDGKERDSNTRVTEVLCTDANESSKDPFKIAVHQPGFPWCYLPGCWCGQGCRHARAVPRESSSLEEEVKRVLISPMDGCQCTNEELKRPPQRSETSESGNIHPRSWWRRYLPNYYFI